MGPLPGFTRSVFIELCTVVLGALLIAPLGLPQAAGAQEPDTSLISGSLSSLDHVAFEAGVEAVRAERYRAAVTELLPLARREPIAYHPTFGSSVTWFGRGLRGQGRTYQARNVWLWGVRRAEATGHTAVGAADALLQSLDPETIQSSPSGAVRAFEHIVGALGRPVSDAEKEPLRRHAAQLALIAPDSLAEALSSLAKGERSSAEVDVGPRLMRWLQAQDPVLATTRNERIVEHLTRVRRAEEKYAWTGRPSGLDDRGETLVRYGRPDRTTTVAYREGFSLSLGGHGYDDPISLPSVRGALRSLRIPRSSFPAAENEVWVYPTLEPPLHFIFVESEEDGDPFLEGTTQDLLPSSIRHSPGPDEAPAYLALYTALYWQLMSVDRRYGRRYGEVANYSGVSDPPLPTFAHLQIARNKDENRRIQQEQAEAPKQKTRADFPHPSMPVAVRTARFLEENGSTRTEVYWGVRPDSLAPPSDWMENSMRLGFEPSGAYLVQATGVLRGPGLRTEAKATRLDTVSVQEVARGRPLSPPPLVLRGEGGAPADSHRVGLEWIQRAVGTGGEKGPLVHVTDRQIGPKPALSADPASLEMSDVVPLAVPEEGTALPTSELETRRRVIPYERVIPYKEISAAQPIALGFEVYHLTFGAEDRTRYTVEYEVTAEEKRGGISGLFDDTRTARTATSSTYSGTSRRATEYILLELSESLDLPARTPVEVTVRVTDEVSGQAVSRSIALTLVSEGSS